MNIFVLKSIGKYLAVLLIPLVLLGYTYTYAGQQERLKLSALNREQQYKLDLQIMATQLVLAEQHLAKQKLRIATHEKAVTKLRNSTLPVLDMPISHDLANLLRIGHTAKATGLHTRFFGSADHDTSSD